MARRSLKVFAEVQMVGGVGKTGAGSLRLLHFSAVLFVGGEPAG
jgi:hypothetical protein